MTGKGDDEADDWCWWWKIVLQRKEGDDVVG